MKNNNELVNSNKENYLIDIVRNAVIFDDIEKTKEILFSNIFYNYSTEEKEKYLLVMATSLCGFIDDSQLDLGGKKVIDYLIFDYRISSEKYIEDIKNLKYKNQIEAMFNLRRLNDELKQGLYINQSKVKQVKL